MRDGDSRRPANVEAYGRARHFIREQGGLLINLAHDDSRSPRESNRRARFGLEPPIG
jgi:hypothetical protein